MVTRRRSDDLNASNYSAIDQTIESLHSKEFKRIGINAASIYGVRVTGITPLASGRRLPSEELSIEAAYRMTLHLSDMDRAEGIASLVVVGAPPSSAKSAMIWKGHDGGPNRLVGITVKDDTAAADLMNDWINAHPNDSAFTGGPRLLRRKSLFLADSRCVVASAEQ
jgi:hypothetical protein